MTSKSTSSQEPNIAFSMEDFAKALEKHDYQFHKGQIVKGKICQHSSEGVYVDIGGKSPGFVPSYEVSLDNQANIATIMPLDTEATFLIISDQNSEGQVTLSRRQLQLKQAWEEVAAMADSGKSVQVRISGINRGGVTGEIHGLKAFIPRSHLSQKDDLESLVGQLLTVNFLEANPETKKIVLSQRQAAQADVIKTIADKTLVSGRIVSIKPYGVFVDINGLTGLLHITQISNNRVSSLENLFQPGQEIQVFIWEIDEIKNRISLSLKVLEEYPGEILEKFGEVMATAEERAAKVLAKLNQTPESATVS